jgi:hypothetical protein
MADHLCSQSIMQVRRIPLWDLESNMGAVPLRSVRRSGKKKAEPEGSAGTWDLC